MKPWEDRWQHGRTGWDQSHAHPALVELISGAKADELGVPKLGKAVIPGCGRGYDVDLLAQRGLDAVGVDISPTGVGEAKKWLEAQSKKQGSVDVVVADFFAWASENKGQADVLLDYTFLCALPPTLRPKWAQAFATLAKPSSTSRLITLMFPLHETIPEGADHPPYPLRVQDYHDLLDSTWELVHFEPVGGDLARSGEFRGSEAVGVWAWRG